MSAAQATVVSVCDGCSFLLGSAFGVHATHFSRQTMPSRLRAYDVFVHSGSPIDLIVRHLLPGVHVDLDTFKVFFDYV